MQSVPGMPGQRKAGDIPLATTRREDVLGWLGGDAEYQAALCVRAVGLLLHTGWPLPALRALVEYLQAQAFMQRVVEQVTERSPAVDYGPARVERCRFGGELHLALPRARVASVSYVEE
jgi:hypothetical protein